MTVFLLDDELREKVQRVRSHAEDPAHFYIPGETEVPGYIKEHRFTHADYMVCFSITRHQGKLFRFLTVSIKAWHDGDRSRYPLPEAVFTLAHLFGFSGAESDSQTGLVSKPGPWGLGPNKEEGCIIVQQRVTEEQIRQESGISQSEAVKHE